MPKLADMGLVQALEEVKKNLPDGYIFQDDNDAENPLNFGVYAFILRAGAANILRPPVAKVVAFRRNDEIVIEIETSDLANPMAFQGLGEIKIKELES
ncbi:MAG: hypothetical protein HYV90_06020 [Candidatus Woesebacteria bacterium]|nr:MAG: hypothetical protein HYV90_06020 [Candidatus Woesebacteria bacterium]